MNRLMAASRKLTPSSIFKHHNILSPQYYSTSSSPYMNTLFPLSNSSFNLTPGNSLQSDVVRLTDDVFLVDAGIGTPRTCLQDELIGAQKNKKTRFQNRVGYLDQTTREPQINKQLLERFFVDLVAGDSVAKQRSTARFNDLAAGAADTSATALGEPNLVLPRRYRQKRAWMELNRIWRSNSQVKGFVVGRVRAGYSVAIAGFVVFLPFRPHLHARRMWNDRFTIESINPKNGNVVVI